MKKKLNNKGFTLVELLAVLVILIAIMGIAIPSISSSLERTKDRQNKARFKIIESAAEQYVTDYKNTVYSKLNGDGKCAILISDLGNYLSSDDMKDAEGNDISLNYVIFTRPNNYEYKTSDEGLNSCK